VTKFPAAVGDILAPILFMIFVGYQAGKYFDKMGGCIAAGLLIGFVVAMFNMWKLMKKLGRNDE
jgi:Mn2+/Fe2+ NRAMP family transporter